MAQEEDIKVVARNRKAHHDYHIEDRYEAGLVLQGTEIKSIRNGRVNLRDGYVRPRGGELWLLDVHIGPYEPAGRYFGHDPRRPRKLLLHRYQIDRLTSEVDRSGYTIIPLRMYLKNGLAKVEIALATGKAKHDKRRAIAERDALREIDRALRDRRR
ncbi:MAG: SsrA-binding protein SmpB [Chloroflexota bacterium]|nr:SsrA-binding protein SmpB [Chloroflexota bacterium]